MRKSITFPDDLYTATAAAARRACLPFSAFVRRIVHHEVKRQDARRKEAITQKKATADTVAKPLTQEEKDDFISGLYAEIDGAGSNNQDANKSTECHEVRQTRH